MDGNAQGAGRKGERMGQRQVRDEEGGDAAVLVLGIVPVLFSDVFPAQGQGQGLPTALERRDGDAAHADEGRGDAAVS